MLALNTLLLDAGIAPERAIVVRHRAHEPALHRVMPWIAAERPDLFRVYQQIQVPRLEAALTRADTLVAFIAHGPRRALFTRVYKVCGSAPLSFEEYWAIPENQELKDHGMRGLRREDPTPLRFDLQEADTLSEWTGKLVIGWPGLERSWWRWADRNIFPVEAITEESRLVEGMPSWDELVLAWDQLALLPASWQAALSQWRGIYFIFDVVRERGYVGSASGKENILGRWRNYAATGHGGNVALRKSNPADLRFSILQRTSPDLDAKEVVHFEDQWKKRLHTVKYGLNEN
jgi:hypothetical protein